MQNFDRARFARYLRYELVSRRSELMLPMLLPPALYTLWALGRFLNGGPIDAWGTVSFVLALALGLAAAVGAHRQDVDPATGPYHLLLPASHVERFWTRWSLSFVPMVLGQLVILTVLAYLFATIAWLMGRGAPRVDLPEARSLLIMLGLYGGAHGSFFAGGIFFKRSPFIKTLLTMTVYGAVVSIATLVLAVVGVVHRMQYDVSSLVRLQAVDAELGVTATVVFTAWAVLLPVLMYAAAYYKAREYEVRG